MKKLFFYFSLFFLFFNIEGNSDEISPVKQDFEEIFNIGKMLSHDSKFTLYFRTREKAVLAKGEEFTLILIDIVGGSIGVLGNGVSTDTSQIVSATVAWVSPATITISPATTSFTTTFFVPHLPSHPR